MKNLAVSIIGQYGYNELKDISSKVIKSSSSNLSRRHVSPLLQQPIRWRHAAIWSPKRDDVISNARRPKSVRVCFCGVYVYRERSICSCGTTAQYLYGPERTQGLHPLQRVAKWLFSGQGSNARRGHLDRLCSGFTSRFSSWNASPDR